MLKKEKKKWKKHVSLLIKMAHIDCPLFWCFVYFNNWCSLDFHWRCLSQCFKESLSLSLRGDKGRLTRENRSAVSRPFFFPEVRLSFGLCWRVIYFFLSVPAYLFILIILAFLLFFFILILSSFRFSIPFSSTSCILFFSY